MRCEKEVVLSFFLSSLSLSTYLLVLDTRLLGVVLGRLVAAVLLVLDARLLWVVLGRLILVWVVDGEIARRLGGESGCSLVGLGETLGGLLRCIEGTLDGERVKADGGGLNLRGVRSAVELALEQLVVLDCQGGLAVRALEAELLLLECREKSEI
jgi:hypothetical protein